MKTQFLLILIAFSVSFTFCKKKKDETPAPAPPNPLPTVTTKDISIITNTTASGGGVVTSEGTAALLEQGICWSSNQNPTTVDPHTALGSTGVAPYTCTLGGLVAYTTYYVRAYAKNFNGTAYGQQVSFKTAAQWSTTVTNGTPFLPVFQGNSTLYSFDFNTAELLRSTDPATWTHILNNLTPVSGAYFLANGNEVYLSTSSGGSVFLEKSIDNGNIWTQIATTQTVYSPRLIGKIGNTLITHESSDGFYSTANDGTNWTRSSFGTPLLTDYFSNGTCAMAWNANVDSIFRTTDGSSWTCINAAFPVGTSFNSLKGMTQVGSKIFAAAGNKRVLVSSDNGITWTQFSATDLPSTGYAMYLTANGSNMVVEYLAQGPFLSRDGGNTWNYIGYGRSSQFQFSGQTFIFNNWIYTCSGMGYLFEKYPL